MSVSICAHQDETILNSLSAQNVNFAHISYSGTGLVMCGAPLDLNFDLLRVIRILASRGCCLVLKERTKAALQFCTEQ